MIPYDDLVAALQTWRSRQGLAVASLAPIAAPTAAAAPAAPAAKPASAPNRVPPPLAPVDTRDEDVDDSALIEETHYENEGDDFAMAFNNLEQQPGVDSDFESTSIGTPPPPTAAPPRDSFGGSTEPEPPPGKHNRNDDW